MDRFSIRTYSFFILLALASRSIKRVSCGISISSTGSIKSTSSGSTTTDTIVRNCEPIRIELCRGIGYNETSMPNLVGHEIQTDADFTLQTFSPLIQYGCSSQLHFFLCSAYVPMCTPKVPVPIGPCRGLCETVRARCNPVLQGFGFPWPTALECSRFPKENNHEHMCMEGPGEPTSGKGISIINSATKTTSLNIHQHHLTCQTYIKSHLYVRLSRSTGKCAPLCEADILFDQQEKGIAEIWITCWSVAALSTAIIAIFCIILSDIKWDRILVPLVTCNSLVAIGWTVRWVAGRNTTSCGYDPKLPGILLLLTDGLSNPPCAATFLLRYYFGMAGSVWWGILCLKWHFSIRPGRNTMFNQTVGNKNKDTFGSLAQLAAWGIPALQTVSILVVRGVDADELLGSCFVGNQSDKTLRVLVAMPLFCFWVFGSVNLFAGYLVQRRNVNAAPSNNYTKTTNPNGLGTFLFIYCIPNALLMISVFYEFANRDTWLLVPQPSTEPMSAVKAPMWPFMLRAFMELLVGMLASAWTLGPRIASLYRRNAFTTKIKPLPVIHGQQKHLDKSSSLKLSHQPPYSSSASYHSVRPQQSVLSTSSVMSKMSGRGGIKLDPPRKYPSIHSHRKTRIYKLSSQSINLTGNETVL